MLKNINEHLINQISDLLGKDNTAFIENSTLLEIHMPKEKLIQVIRFLQEDDKLYFTTLIDVFGVDYPLREKRFEIIYNLLSTKFNYRVAIKIMVSEEEEAPSICKLFSNAIWYEREIYDMYGIKFADNPDMRRILTDYGFEGHPLRKDFPLTGYKEVRYDFEQERVIYEPVKLVQDYRKFDFISPWSGTEYHLPGDEKAENQK